MSALRLIVVAQRIELDGSDMQFLSQTIVQITCDGLPFANLGKRKFTCESSKLFRALAHALLEFLVHRGLGLNLCLRRSFGLRDIGKRDDDAGYLSAFGAVRHDAAQIDSLVFEFLRTWRQGLQDDARILDEG